MTVSFAPTVLAQVSTGGESSGSALAGACGQEPAVLCRLLFEATGSETFAGVGDDVISRGLRIVVIAALALVLARLLRRAIQRFGTKMAREHERSSLRSQRSAARSQTVTGFLSSIAAVAVWTVGVLLVLGEVGISLAPLLAGAGVVGIALGFGAQSVVSDFLAGFFMLAEDQYGVGDVIDIGEVVGTVEDVTLRTTTLRDVNGTVWHVPNHEIQRVGNLSQLWSRAVLDIDVAYDTDLRRAAGIIQRVADDLWQDDSFTHGDIIEPPEVWGVERLGVDGVSIRLVVTTDPSDQFMVARELRLRIKEALDEAHIEVPFAQRTVWLRHDEPVARGDRPHAETSEPRLPQSGTDHGQLDTGGGHRA